MVSVLQGFTLLVFLGCCSSAYDLEPGVTCGLNLNDEEKIVGGDFADLGQFPWQAYFQPCGDTGCYVCGATIISDRWLVTAAHCSDEAEASQSHVRVGTLTKGGGGTVYDLDTITNHPSWSGDLGAGQDIALLRTDTAMALNSNVGPACLPLEDYCFAEGSEAWISGYGTTSSGGSLSTALMYTSVPLVTLSYCRSVFGSSLPDIIICAGTPEGGVGNCQGDSGGPLAIRKDNIWYNYGIVSFGSGCAEPGVPTGYTRLTQFVDWILDNTQNEITATYANACTGSCTCEDLGTSDTDSNAFGVTVTTAPPSADSYDLNPGVTCGVHTERTKVVGGEFAELGQFPWQAYFQPCGGGACYICGATIMSDRWLVTAAHCSDEAIATQSHVRVGTLQRGTGGTTYNLDTITNHPSWNPNVLSAGNDIALLRTDSQMTLNLNVHPACLPLENYCFAAGSEAWISGYGDTSHGGNLATALLFAKVPLVTYSYCSSVYGIPNSIVCAGTEAGGVGNCQGDSGGPLAIRKDNIWHNYGIVSFGAGCADPGTPTAYTRLTDFVDWILANTRNEITATYVNICSAGKCTCEDLGTETTDSNVFDDSATTTANPITTTADGGSGTTNSSTITVASDGVLQSTPRPYLANTNIEWILTAEDPETTICGVFTLFDVEGSATCAWDYVLVTVDDVEMPKYCSRDNHNPATTATKFTGTEIRIQLVSDGTLHYDGFDFTYIYGGNTTATTTAEPETTSVSPSGTFTLEPGITCGVHQSTLQRIVGGDFASLGQFSWQAFFQPCGQGSCYICGATIISNFWLISAAHCSDDAVASESHVRVGTLARGSGGDSYGLSTIVNHPNWSGTASQGSDISLLRTSMEMSLNSNVQPACIPAEDLCFSSGSEAWLSGYGTTSEGGNLASALQFVQVPIVTLSSCRETYFNIPNILVCSGTDDGGVDSCQGDSGGPMALRKNNIWYHYGVVSYGAGCARPGIPGVYTRVTNFVDWILSNTNNEISAPYATTCSGSCTCEDTGSDVADADAFTDNPTTTEASTTSTTTTVEPTTTIAPDPCDNHDCSNQCSADTEVFFCSCPEGTTLSTVDHRTCISTSTPCDSANCSHACMVDGSSFQCACPPGMTAGSDGSTCENLPQDPCTGNQCSDVCFSNNSNAPECACPAGLVLDSDNLSCITASSGGSTFTIVRSDNTIRAHNNDNLCLHKRFSGYNAGDPVYVVNNCDGTNLKNQWTYSEETQQIQSVGALAKGKTLCIAVRRTDVMALRNTWVSHCGDGSDPKTKFVFINGQIVNAENQRLCLSYHADGNENLKSVGCNWKANFLSEET